MVVLVTGGSASGKSAFAEEVCLKLGGEKIYIATMQVWDEEGRARVRRHRAMRAGKGFSTLECPLGLEQAEMPLGCTALLECLSNLAANEMFDPAGAGKEAYEAISRGLERLMERCENLVVVTNEVFSDGVEYPEETERYLALLGRVNGFLARRADAVYEVVCGIPILVKGETI